MIIAPEHKLDIAVKKILVIQLGDIGDVVWSIPALWALKAAFPRAGLYVIVRKNRGDFLLDDPHVDGLFIVDEESFFNSLVLIRKIRAEKFDLLFDLRADDRGAYISLLSGAKIRAAKYYPSIPWRNRMFTHLVEDVPSKQSLRGAAQQSLKIVRGFGIAEKTAIPRIFVAGGSREKVKRLLMMEKISAEKGFVTINPFSRWSYKEWGLQKWLQLANFVRQRYGMPVVVTGSGSERKRAEALIAEGGAMIYNLAGRTTLREMAALLEKSRLHVGVDSAAPHIAAAVGTPTVTLFGPSDWMEWAPPGAKNTVVHSDMDCVPCRQKGCDGHGRSKCLEDLSAESVQSAVRAALEQDGGGRGV